ncbi:MAG: ATP synthase F0 subunit B [Desulfobacterales bacterium]|nr:ATP synthase F0 subunit B [Desulfobacterales bacterium]
MKRLLFDKYASCAVLVIVVFVIFGSVCCFASSGGEHDGSASAKKGWVATDTYRVMNFAVLAIGLILIARKPVATMLSSRIREIKQQLEALEQQKKEAEQSLSLYREKLVAIETEVKKIQEMYVDQGKKAKEKLLQEATETVKKLQDQAKKNIEQEYRLAQKKLQEELLEKALLKAEMTIKNSITMMDQERLVDEYINKVVVQ